MKEQRILQAHCQSPTSQRSDLSFVKELAKPTQTKLYLKKLQRFKKNKKRITQPDTDQQMTVAIQTPKPLTVKRFNTQWKEGQLIIE